MSHTPISLSGCTVVLNLALIFLGTLNIELFPKECHGLWIKHTTCYLLAIYILDSSFFGPCSNKKGEALYTAYSTKLTAVFCLLYTTVKSSSVPTHFQLIFYQPQPRQDIFSPAISCKFRINWHVVLQ